MDTIRKQESLDFKKELLEKFEESLPMGSTQEIVDSFLEFYQILDRPPALPEALQKKINAKQHRAALAVANKREKQSASAASAEEEKKV